MMGIEVLVEQERCDANHGTEIFLYLRKNRLDYIYCVMITFKQSFPHTLSVYVLGFSTIY